MSGDALKQPFPEGLERPAEAPVIVVRGRVVREIRDHAASSLAREVCGVLLGRRCRDDKGEYLHVRDLLRATAVKSGAGHVTFTAESWEQIHRDLEARGGEERIVGWYHSHPDFGIFLSEMDRFIQKEFFGEPWQVAMVVDPVRREEGIFAWRGGKIERVNHVAEGQAGSPHAGGDALAGLRRDVRGLGWLVLLVLAALIVLIWKGWS